MTVGVVMCLPCNVISLHRNTVTPVTLIPAESLLQMKWCHFRNFFLSLHLSCISPFVEMLVLHSERDHP